VNCHQPQRLVHELPLVVFFFARRRFGLPSADFHFHVMQAVAAISLLLVVVCRETPHERTSTKGETPHGIGIEERSIQRVEFVVH
jgi:hypothetical protein